MSKNASVILPGEPYQIAWSQDNVLALLTGGKVKINIPIHGAEKQLVLQECDLVNDNGLSSQDDSLSDDDDVVVPNDIVQQAGNCAIIAIAWSPSRVSSACGCVLAVVTEYFDIAFYGPTRNLVRNQWEPVASLKAYLSHHEQYKNAPVNLYSMSWCAETSFTADGLLCTAYFVAGANDGTLLVCSFSERELKLLTTLHLSQDRILHIVWSPWLKTAQKTYTALVAVASLDGSISIVPMEYDVETASLRCKAHIQVFGASRRRPTRMQWSPSTANSGLLLVIALPKTLRCVSVASMDLPLSFKTFDISLKSFARCTGLAFIDNLSPDGTKKLILRSYFLRGGFEAYSLHTESAERLPEDTQGPTHLTSIQSTKTDVFKSPDLRIHEALQSPDGLLFAIVYSLLPLEKWVYMIDSAAKATLIISSTYSQTEFMEKHSNRLRSLLSDPLTISFAFSIWEFQKLPAIDPSNNIQLQYTELLQDQPVRNFGRTTSEHVNVTFTRNVFERIYSNMNLKTARYRIALALTAVDVHNELTFLRPMAKADTSYIRSQIFAVGLDMAGQMIRSKEGPLLWSSKSSTESLFLYLDLASLLEPKFELHRKVKELRDELMARHNEVTTSSESCAACSGSLSRDKVYSSTCSNGHVWPRCSVSLLTLMTTDHLSCTGCGRKCISNRIDIASDFLDRLLAGYRLCPFCSSPWARNVSN